MLYKRELKTFLFHFPPKFFKRSEIRNPRFLFLEIDSATRKSLHFLVKGIWLNLPMSSESERKTVDGTHQFVIKGYRLTKGMGVDKYIESHSFDVGGYEWEIHYYPDRKKQDTDETCEPSNVGAGQLSLYIALKTECSQLETTVFLITLVDQSGKEMHKTLTYIHGELDNAPVVSLENHRRMWGSVFFKHSLLEENGYIKDDCLIINGTVTVYFPQVPFQPGVHVPDSELGSHFGALLDSMEGSDVTFDIAGEKFLAHKLVLAARSPFFKSKFFIEIEENSTEVMINDLEPKVFKVLLEFMYRDYLPEEDLEPVRSDTFDSLKLSEMYDLFVVKLLASADKYKLDRLRLFCEAHICKGVSVKSVANILILADRHNATELKNGCLKYAAESLVGVRKTDGYNELVECFHLQSELLKAVANLERGRDDSGSPGRTHSLTSGSSSEISGRSFQIYDSS